MKTLSEKIAVMQAAERGEKIEVMSDFFGDWVVCADKPAWDWATRDYRVAREEASIDWKAVSKRMKALVPAGNGEWFAAEWYTENNGIFYPVPPKVWASAFSSFRPGNIPWSEAQPIKRPEGK